MFFPLKVGIGSYTSVFFMRASVLPQYLDPLTKLNTQQSTTVVMLTRIKCRDQRAEEKEEEQEKNRGTIEMRAEKRSNSNLK